MLQLGLHAGGADALYVLHAWLLMRPTTARLTPPGASRHRVRPVPGVCLTPREAEALCSHLLLVYLI